MDVNVAIALMVLFTLGPFVLIGLGVWWIVGAQRTRSVLASLGTPEYQRRRASREVQPGFAQAGAALGFQPASRIGPRIATAVESLFGAVEVERALHRRIEGGLLTLCEIRISRSTDMIESCETILLFEGSANVRFPPFHVIPRTPLFGTAMFGALIRALGGGSVDALRDLDDPEFQARLMIGTGVPDDVRPMLTADVRQVLAQNCEFVVMANDDCLAVSLAAWSGSRSPHSGTDAGAQGVIAVSDWPTFVSRATAVVQSLRRSERRTREERAAGVAGQRATELRTALAQPPPRNVSRSLAAAGVPRHRFLRLWAGVTGGLVTLVGGSMLAAAGGRLFGSILILLGGVVVALQPLHRWWSIRSRSWMLRHGHLVRATVVDVSTSHTVYVEGPIRRRRHDATFAFDLDGEPRRGTQSVFGTLGYRLVKLRQSKQPTDVLVDANRPDDILWVDVVDTGSLSSCR